MKLALFVFGVALLWWNRDDMVDPPPKTLGGWLLDTAVKTVSIMFFYYVFTALLMQFD